MGMCFDCISWDSKDSFVGNCRNLKVVSEQFPIEIWERYHRECTKREMPSEPRAIKTKFYVNYCPHFNIK